MDEWMILREEKTKTCDSHFRAALTAGADLFVRLSRSEGAEGDGSVLVLSVGPGLAHPALSAAAGPALVRRDQRCSDQGAGLSSRWVPAEREKDLRLSEWRGGRLIHERITILLLYDSGSIHQLGKSIFTLKHCRKRVRPAVSSTLVTQDESSVKRWSISTPSPT